MGKMVGSIKRAQKSINAVNKGDKTGVATLNQQKKPKKRKKTEAGLLVGRGTLGVEGDSSDQKKLDESELAKMVGALGGLDASGVVDPQYADLHADDLNYMEHRGPQVVASEDGGLKVIGWEQQSSPTNRGTISKIHDMRVFAGDVTEETTIRDERK